MSRIKAFALAQAACRAGMLAILAAFAAAPAVAQDYPVRPIKIVAPFGAGGPGDVFSRQLAQYLPEILKETVIVENRPGAASIIGTDAVAKSAPDGYTLLTCLTANAINASLYPNLDFNFLRDVVPVAGLIALPMVFLVNPSFPAKTFSEFLAYAKANPGKINLASPGVGTPMQVAGELINLMAGVNMVGVPYRGPAPAFTDLLANRITAFIITITAAIGFVRDGRLRALAVTGAKRSPILPDVPAIGEFLPGFAATAWDGTCAPKGTPPEVIAKLNATINAGLADPQIKAKLKDLGGDIMSMTPAEFGKFLGDETAKWAKVVKFSGAKPN
jgi:tripartite-type tricarboxylate transporter receptor subunit TctC